MCFVFVTGIGIHFSLFPESEREAETDTETDVEMTETDGHRD